MKERRQEHYPTSAKVHNRCRAVFLVSFHLCLNVSAHFSVQSLAEMIFYTNIFLQFVFFFLGFIDHHPDRDERIYCAGDEQSWSWGLTRFALVMNSSVQEMNELKKHLQTSAPLPPTHSQLPATFKQNLSQYDSYIYSRVFTSVNRRQLSRSRTYLQLHYTRKLYKKQCSLRNETAFRQTKLIKKAITKPILTLSLFLAHSSQPVLHTLSSRQTRSATPTQLLSERPRSIRMRMQSNLGTVFRP